VARDNFLHHSNYLSGETRGVAGAGGEPKYIFPMHACRGREENISVFNSVRRAARA
jgi:hypothetical protein